jgi:hypothetical protein
MKFLGNQLRFLSGSVEGYKTPYSETNDFDATDDGGKASLSNHPRNRPRNGSERHSQAHAAVTGRSKVLASIS